eukprot:CAMPEP_0119044490 /NCGR_PEP_ID=MMETSP1177-20130426/31808_1 /TAXON_ID=2985 /ORGANISM="Ochromonas sp, Strain CCMP1899" /LENGTH=499 /DNA_ID=CAMNT_0007014645 /DNA_START=39 /DNA_END=1534 /DNA_ORIENTATION=-
MKFDVTCMRYLSKDDYRVLVAVEMGMRNHELVPIELIANIAKLRHGGSHKILSTLLRYKLVAHAQNQYNGYRLSYLGFDILALRALLGRGTIVSVGPQIGVGKESDIFEALDENGNEVVLKVHRLGRTSFRAVRRQRDYMQGKSKASWLFMSRLAAVKEFAFMKALHAHGFPTPTPIDQSRHIVAMSRIPGFPMSQIKAGKMEWAEEIFHISLEILRRLAQHGLVHCDFNEFNLMVDQTGQVTLIDFPQMVSTSHPNASDLFARDLGGLVKFFAMKMRYVPPDEDLCKLEDIVVLESNARIDEEVRASGFSKDDDDLLMRFIHTTNDDVDVHEDGDEDDEEDSEEEEEEEEVIEDNSHDNKEKNKSKNKKNSKVNDFLNSSDNVFGNFQINSNEKINEKNDIEGHLNTENIDKSNIINEQISSNSAMEKEGFFDNDDSEDEGTRASEAPTLTEDALQRVKEKTRNAIRKQKGGKITLNRNQTKRRNKYGNIERADKIDS